MKTLMAILLFLGAALAPQHHVQPLTSVHSSASAANGGCAQPPANLNPATVSDAELQTYGLPPRHILKGGGLDPEWVREITHAKHRFCPSDSAARAPGIRAAWHRPHTITNTATSTVWSGYEEIGAAYDARMVDYRVPCIANSSKVLGQNHDATFWVGIGGDGSFDGGNTGNLLQTGAYELWNGSSTTYYLWIEDYPDDPSWIQTFNFTCSSDYLANEVWYWPGRTPQWAYMFSQNLTTNQYSTYHNASAFPNNLTAEWITESPAHDCGTNCTIHYDLAEWGSGVMTYTNCELETSDGSAHGYDENFVDISMVNSFDNDLLASTNTMYPYSGSERFHFDSDWGNSA